MIWAIIPGWIKRALAWAGAALVAIGAVWVAATRSASQRAALKAARGAVKAHETRDRIEDAIDQDTDLAARARRIGLQRDAE